MRAGGVAGVGLEDGRALDGRRAGVAADAAVHERPRTGCPGRSTRGQRRRLLLDDVGAAGAAAALVLGEAVVGAALLDDGRVDAGLAAVLPDLRLAEGDEVAGGGVEHPVVGVAGVAGVALGVELRGPEHDVLTGGPRPSRPPAPRCCRRSAGRPARGAASDQLHEVGGLPDLEVAAALALGAVPVAVAADREVGGDQEEPVALGGADEERVAQAHARPCVDSSTGWPSLSSSQRSASLPRLAAK